MVRVCGKAVRGVVRWRGCNEVQGHGTFLHEAGAELHIDVEDETGVHEVARHLVCHGGTALGVVLGGGFWLGLVVRGWGVGSRVRVSQVARHLVKGLGLGVRG